MNSEVLVSYSDNGDVSLNSPVAMPSASAFLWNPSMMIQMTARGFATAQFSQPEPAKYAYAPNLEAKTFMQPEQPYYAHHPGRFFYIKENQTKSVYSLPFEPVRASADEFSFNASSSSIYWKVRKGGLHFELRLNLHPSRPLELWELTISNHNNEAVDLDVFPYFPIGYMSWMNQSAKYDENVNAIVADSVTPYQKVDDYFRHLDFKDKTFFMAEEAPKTWEARQMAFEGEGGLMSPLGVERGYLSGSKAAYETPTAAMHYSVSLEASESRSFRFAFGAAKDTAEIQQIQTELFGEKNNIKKLKSSYQCYLQNANLPLKIQSPDEHFDHFINHWLGRQIFYHGDVNRLTTDPQTRNFLQDHMGMSYLHSERARESFVLALSQQSPSGAMPDGVLLHSSAELKYINQVPHMDHCAWLPITLSAYLHETGDYSLLDEVIVSVDSSGHDDTVFNRISSALNWLFDQQDERGLNYIQQGDWNDPMNMVGYKGKGVSVWLTLATAYACKVWSDICHELDNGEQARHFLEMTQACNSAVNKHAWSGDRYARGITDDGRLFGIDDNAEGKIFLNPQAWAVLSGAANKQQKQKLFEAVEANLETHYGVQMLAPAYTKMHEDIGRLTQKFPGSAENGAIYNHAGAFYVYALFKAGEVGRAVKILRQMIPGPDLSDLIQRGQLPVFIPNYYRGAIQQYPHTAGRSSQLFNTGTVHWVLRSLIDGLTGLQGCKDGLLIHPQLPSDWPKFSVVRKFRGVTIDMTVVRDKSISEKEIYLDGEKLNSPFISLASLRQGKQTRCRLKVLVV